MTALLLLRAYWQAAVIVALLAAVGVQSYRLKAAEADLAGYAAVQAEFEADLAIKHAQGVVEGVKQQQEAQAALDARRANMAAAKLRQAEARVRAAEARAARLAKAISAAKAGCLYEPLDEAILEEFRQ